MNLIFTTRYGAYRRQNIIEQREDRWLFDQDFDFTQNCFLTMTSIDHEFVSTFRIHVGRDLSAALPSRRVFGDLIDPYLSAGLTVVDPTRLAARLEASKAYPELPFAALRPAWLAAEHFDADIVLATVAHEHTSFYQRVFGYKSLCEPRDYPKVRFKIVCMALDFRAAKRMVETRYPFFQSTRGEREALFGIPTIEEALAARDLSANSVLASARSSPAARLAH